MSPLPVDLRRLQRLERFRPNHLPYRAATSLPRIDRVEIEAYATAIRSYLYGRQSITTAENIFLFYFSRILSDLNLATEALDLDKLRLSRRISDTRWGLNTDNTDALIALDTATKANWRFLPDPQNLSASELIGLLRSHFSHFEGLASLNFQVERVEMALSLKPIQICVGLEEFVGYYAFVFPGDRILFECPAYGNAAYIARGDWRELSQKTKAELQRYGRRIIHGTRSWRSEVRHAIKTR